MFQSLRSLYTSVQCAVKVNNDKTDWFSVKSGLKQGCILSTLMSTLMFNLYINDLSETLSKLNKGIFIDDEYINHLFYADDLALITESESDLQYLLDVMLDVMYAWSCLSVEKRSMNTRTNINI